MGRKADEIANSLYVWMEWCRQERIYVRTGISDHDTSQLAGKRDGILKGLMDAEAHLGLLMLECGVDLSPEACREKKRGKGGK